MSGTNRLVQSVSVKSESALSKNLLNANNVAKEQDKKDGKKQKKGNKK